MIIEIDGYENGILLKSNRKLSINEIRGVYIKAKVLSRTPSDLPRIICEIGDMEIVSYDDGTSQIVIDTDTDRIYKPRR